MSTMHSFARSAYQQPAKQCHKSLNVGDVERVASIVAGGGVALLGLRKLDSLAGIALAALGGGLIYRGVTGHCNMYEKAGITTVTRNPATGVPAQRGAHVQKSVLINCEPEDVYAFWRKLDNLPRFMKHLTSVTPTSMRTSHWVAKGPFGKNAEWDAEIINEKPNQLLAWRSLPGSEVDTAGSVHFLPGPTGHGTEVVVSLKYDPPGGKLGIGVAKLFLQDPQSQIEEDLRRLKQICETGELATTEGQTSGRTPASVGSGVHESRPAVLHDPVAAASDDSFPASDPPSWTATSATTNGGDIL